MLSINSVETQEMLKGIAASGVKIDESRLDDYLSKKVIEVDVSVSKKGLSVGLSLKKLGVRVSDLPNHLRDFFADGRVKGGSISILPTELDKRIDKIERQLRASKDRLALPGSKGRYISYDQFDEFMEAVEEAKAKMDEAKMDIATLWAPITDNFRECLKSSLDILSNEDVSLSDIMAKVPTLEEFQENVGVSVEVRPFPVVSVMEDVPDKIADQFKKTAHDEVVSMVQSTVAESLNTAFANSNRIVKAGAFEERIPIMSLKKAKSMASDLRKINVFCNPAVEEIASIYDKIATKAGDSDELASCAELAMTKIWAYAHRVGIDIDLTDCVIKKAHLDVMAGLGKKKSA